MNSIIGLDLSLGGDKKGGTGFVALQDGTPVLTQLLKATEGMKGVQRLSELRVLLSNTICNPAIEDLPQLAVIEGYSMHSVGMAYDIGEWGGVTRLLLHDMGIPFIAVAPTTLKKYASGGGQAQKDEMRLAVFKRWGFEHKSNDVVDAYALARFGQAYLAVRDGSCEVDGKPLSKADTDIIKRFMEPPKKKRKAVGE